jgi:outer membrane protein OmpA-like peptidoglycan-associated protein
MSRTHKSPWRSQLLPLPLLMPFLLAFGLAVPTIASAAAPVSGQDIVAVLQKIEHSDALALEAWLEGAGGGQVRVGDAVGFRFRSGSSAYLTTLYVDAGGALTVLNSGGDEDRIEAGQVSSFPPEGSNQQLVAQAPLGTETVFAIATLEALPQHMFADADQKRIVVFERPEDGRHLAQRLADYLSILPEGSVDLASFSHEIVSASTPQRYSESQIVQHFTTQTRSLRRQKLDLDIQFEFGSDQLTPAAKSDLDELGRALEHPAMKKRRFELSGHTDDVGSASYNMMLSRKRAESARKYLLSRYGIDAKTIQSEGYGEGRPVMPGGSDEARRRNRRVVIEQLP